MLRAEHKWALFCLKFIPVIMFLSMWLYAICGLFGFHLWIADTIVGCSVLPAILIFSLSQVFHFCALHKSLTGYSLVVDILINIDKYLGFGSALFPIQLIVVMIGLALFIWLLYKQCLCKQNCVYMDFYKAKNKKDKIKV